VYESVRRTRFLEKAMVVSGKQVFRERLPPFLKVLRTFSYTILFSCLPPSSVKGVSADVSFKKKETGKKYKADSLRLPPKGFLHDIKGAAHPKVYSSENFHIKLVA